MVIPSPIPLDAPVTMETCFFIGTRTHPFPLPLLYEVCNRSGLPDKHRQAGLPRGLDQVNRDVDVPSRGFRIRTSLVRAIYQRLRDLSLQTRQADIETSLEKVPVVTSPKVHFGVDGHVRRELHLHFGGNKLYRTCETGRPTNGK